MALTVRQALDHYFEEAAPPEPARQALLRLAALPSHAPAARPTRANPVFPRPGAGSGTVGEAWIYELDPADLEDLLRQDPRAREPAAAFLQWLWHHGLVGAERYEALREVLGLPPDPEVRRRRLEHRLVQLAEASRQPVAEHLINPVLYLGLPGTPHRKEPPRPELEGEFEVLRVEGGALWGRVADREVGPVEVGGGVARLARPGDRLHLVLGREEGRYRVLEARPGFE